MSTFFRSASLFRASEARRPALLALVYVLLLVVKLAWAADQPSPMVVDELGYLGNARYLATGDGLVDGHGRAAYKVGYSFALAPAFLVEDDPAKAYRLAVFTGAFLSSLLFPLLVLLLARLAPRVPWMDRVAVALVASLSPGASAYGQAAMSYNLLSVGVVVFALVALGLDDALRRDEVHRRRLLAYGFALGALLGLLYTVHERAVAMLGASLLVLGVVAVTKRRRGTWPFLGLILGLVPVVSWGNTVKISGATYPSMQRARDVLSVIPSWIDPLVESVGQSWYLLATSSSLAALVLVFVALRPRAEARRLGERGVFWGLTALNVGALFAISVVFMSRAGTENSTYLAYGRYNEAFVPLALALGLYLVHPSRRSAEEVDDRRRWLWAGGVSVLLILGVYGFLEWAREGVFGAGTYVFNTPALYGYTSLVGFRTGYLALCFVVAAVALALSFAWRFRAGIALLLGFVIWQGISVDRFFSWYSEQRDHQHHVADVIYELQPEGGDLSYDDEIWPVFHYYLYDYFLPGHRLKSFERGPLATAPGAFVVTGSNDPEVAGEGVELVTVESLPRDFESYRPHLWVRPGPLQDEILRRGWFFPDHCLECLDPATARASVDVLEPAGGRLRLEGGDETILRLRLRNVGASPWPTRGMLEGTPKSVRIARIWFGEDGERVAERRVDLHQSLLPGQSRERELRVVARGDDGEPLAPGRYRLEIRLGQERVFWLRGQAALQVEVR